MLSRLENLLIPRIFSKRALPRRVLPGPAFGSLLKRLPKRAIFYVHSTGLLPFPLGPAVLPTAEMFICIPTRKKIQRKMNDWVNTTAFCVVAILFRTTAGFQRSRLLFYAPCLPLLKEPFIRWWAVHLGIKNVSLEPNWRRGSFFTPAVARTGHNPWICPGWKILSRRHKICE